MLSLEPPSTAVLELCAADRRVKTSARALLASLLTKTSASQADITVSNIGVTGSTEARDFFVSETVGMPGVPPWSWKRDFSLEEEEEENA